jgi:hypothetical protein
MSELILTADEKEMLAAMPQQLTANQRKLIATKRCFQSWYDKKSFHLVTSDLELITSTMIQHGLDSTVEASYEQVFHLLDGADLLIYAPDPATQPGPVDFTPEMVDRMTSDEYKRHMQTTKGFKELVDSFDEPTKPNLDGHHARPQFKQ